MHRPVEAELLFQLLDEFGVEPLGAAILALRRLAPAGAALLGFAGFAADGTDRKLAFAVVVEDGRSGSRDAAPLACDIIQFCIDAGYIGQPL